MSLVDDSPISATSALSPRLTIMVTEQRVCVPPDLDVGLPELAVIESLARGRSIDDALADASPTDGDPDHLRGFIAVLTDRGLLLTSTPSSRPLPDAPSSVQPLPGPDEQLLLEKPSLFRVATDGFEAVDHEGGIRVRLSAVELLLASRLVHPHTPAALHDVDAASGASLGVEAVDRLVDRLWRGGMLTPADTPGPRTVAAEERKTQMRRAMRLKRSIRTAVERHEADEQQRRERTGVARTRVVPAAFDMVFPPLGLGLIIANAQAYDSGRLNDHYHFCPSWIPIGEQLEELAAEPSVFLFSAYLWSYGECLETSALVKSMNPANVTVFGGPSVPKYEGDSRQFFADHPHVDITVRGEGEATGTEILAALAGRVGTDPDGATDLSVLADVAGLSYRDRDGNVVRTPDRERIVDLDTIPSPFLTGLFDAYTAVDGIDVVIETNRGCPYGCTFCDWGSATLSRIRKYSLDRVYAELEWCAQHGIHTIAPADSNFGIWSRDVDITRKLTELKAVHDSPKGFGVNFAKNTAKHLRDIIQLLIDADIFTYGVLSLQSMDTDTLDAIERQNIRLEKYEELATEFRKAGLPLFVDLMLGLPGQTGASFRNDIQECIDREVQMRIPITTMLVNSPMNEPNYRKRFKIETTNSPLDPKRKAFVVQTSTFTRAEYEDMTDLRVAVLMTEDLGVLRHVARYLRSDLGMREIDFYDRLRGDAAADPSRWPMLALALKDLRQHAMPPVSWRFAIDEVHDWITSATDAADDTALATALTVQHALLPARDRTLPISIELPHDYAAWYQQMMDAKNEGFRSDWHSVVPSLRSFPPATFTVDDPDGVAHWWTGVSVERSSYGVHWELASDVARPLTKLSTAASTS